MKISSLQKTADKLGVKSLQICLQRDGKLWISPKDQSLKRVEDAVLDHFENEGWVGSSAEGGLILNLIKAMSFDAIPNHYRAPCVESIYFQNVHPYHKVSNPELLAAVARASKESIVKNVDFLCSRHPVEEDWGDGNTFTTSMSMLDFFPTLEPWMFEGLFKTAGSELINRIACKFAEDSYEYRKGWPDLTMWRGDDLRFVEVKAPGDRLQASQKKVIEEFVVPFNLDYTLVEVLDEGITGT